MGSFHARNGPGELLARYSFLEPLLEGRRVLEIGAARATDGGSAMFLAERGAAAVLSIEADEADIAAARGAGHHPFVQFQAMAPSALRPGTFDLVLVADGSSLVVNPDEAAGYRRLLAPGGRLVTALPAGGAGLPDLAGEAPAGEPPPYEGFVNALADHFPLVEVAAQTATVGWVFGLPSQDEPEIAMDGTLAGTPDTTAYVAIAGEEPSGLSGFTVVALPVGPLVEAARARQADPAERAAAERRTQEAEGRAQELEARLRDSETRLQDAEARIAQVVEQAQQAEARAREAAEQVEAQARSAAEEAEAQARGAAEQAEARAREADARAEARAQELEQRAQETEGRLRQVEERLGETEARLRETEGRLEETVGRLQEREAQLHEVQDRLTQAEARAADAEARVEGAEGRAREAQALGQVAEETLAAERARVSELTAALAALEVERDGALSARESATAEAEALRAEREHAIRARDTLRAEADGAVAERDRAVEALRQREAERESLIRERETARQREIESQRSREVALAEAVALGESLARAEALATELSRDRDAALAARDDVMSEAGELRISLDEVKLANGSLESQLAQVRGEVTRLVAKAQELEAGAAAGAEARVQALEAALDAEKARSAARDQELETSRAALSVSEEERLKLEAIFADHRTGGIETEAALQAARAEVQASRAALEAALDRATQAETRAADLEDQAEKAGVPHEAHAAELSELKAELRRLELAAARVPELAAAAARVPLLEEAAGRVPELEARLAGLAEAVARTAELEEQAARLPELEARAVRAAELELELSRLSRLQEPDLRVAALEAEVVRLSGLQEAASRVPALEAEVARLAGLTTEPGGVRPEEVEAALEASLGRVRELEIQLEQVTNSAVEAEALRAEVQKLRGAPEGDAGRSRSGEELEELEAQLADAAASREALERKLADLKESSDKKVADARKAAYEAALKAEAARKEAEGARKELGELQAAQGSADGKAHEWTQLRESLEAQVAELQARLEAEAERAGILSAQAAEARAQLESAAERGPGLDHEERLRAAEARAESLARQAVSAEARMRELDAVAAQGAGEPGEDGDALRAELEELKGHRALLEKELADARSMADVAEAQVAEIAGELQAVRWEKDEIEQKLERAARGGAPMSGDAAKLQEELAARMADLALTKREVERLEAVVASLSVQMPPPDMGPGPEVQAQLSAALQRAADAEAALGSARAGASGDHAEALRRAAAEKESVQAQLVERDGKIARLQREVADKTERLGRLAKELGELKAKGLGKIFR